VDFLHRKRRLVIEVDGEYHFFRSKQDGFRTQNLKRMGFTLVRFVNHDVLERPEIVIEAVTALRGPEFAVRF
jgi:very-short-patch-repair endonuclease